MEYSGDMMKTFTKEDTAKIKGWAILLMLIHHCFLSPERYKGQDVSFYPFSEHLINNAAASMKICVALFVFISAYGITKSYKKSCDGDLAKIDFRICRKNLYHRSVKLWTWYFFIFAVAQLWSAIIIRGGRYEYVYGTGFKGVVHFLIDMAGLAELFSTPTFLATFWYLSLAWIIIFVTPLLLMLYRRSGGALLLGLCVLISAALPSTSEHTIAHFPNYIVVMGLAIVSADTDLIEKAANNKTIPGVGKLLLYVVTFFIFLYIRFLWLSQPAVAVADAVIAFINCVLFFEFVNNWPVFKDVFAFIGKYASNIFLIHNFIRIVWYYEFTYSFHYWWLIIAVLLALSLLVSMAIELIKKLIRYDNAVQWLLGKCRED